MVQTLIAQAARWNDLDCDGYNVLYHFVMNRKMRGVQAKQFQLISFATFLSHKICKTRLNNFMGHLPPASTI